MQAQFISSTRSRAERVQAAKETFTYKWWHAVVATVLALITSYFSFVIFVDVHTEPEVTLDIGIIYGRTFKDLEVNAYYGIPYAKPPVGRNRFRRPEALEAKGRYLDARNPRYPCVQPNLYYGNATIVDAYNSSEDCLHLDIYTPRASTYEKLGIASGLSAVLVVLIDVHFANGGNSHFYADPRRFVQKTSIVVVVPNYRIGAPGFMRSGYQRSPGNMGLLDQALMLRWVRDNILSFGGNPHNIVLMGVGGGAVAAGYHLISPMTRGFTRRAILHSGSPMMPFPEPGAEDPILEIAVRAQCIDAGAKTITDSTTVVNCIRRTPTSKLRGAVTDGHFPGANDAFLPEKFGILLEQSHDQSAQVLVGNVINEGRVMVGHSFRNMTSEEWRSTDQNMIRTNLVNFLKPYNVDNITRIINCYLSDQESGSQGQQNVTFQHVASAVLGDMLFVCPMKRFAERFSQRRNRVHYFVFNYSPATTLVQSDDATQFDDLLTLFGINLDSTEFDFSAALMEVWGDFVKSGDLPSGQWTPFTKASKNYVFLSNRKDVKGNFEPKKEFREETCDYWTEYLDKQEKKTSTETRHAYDQCGALNPNI